MMYLERTSGWSKVSKLGRSFNHKLRFMQQTEGNCYQGVTGCSRGPPKESQGEAEAKRGAELKRVAGLRGRFGRFDPRVLGTSVRLKLFGELQLEIQ